MAPASSFVACIIKFRLPGLPPAAHDATYLVGQSGEDGRVESCLRPRHCGWTLWHGVSCCQRICSQICGRCCWEAAWDKSTQDEGIRTAQVAAIAHLVRVRWRCLRCLTRPKHARCARNGEGLSEEVRKGIHVPSRAPLHGSGNSQQVGPDDPSSLSLSVMFVWLLPKACWRETKRRDKKTKARLVMWRSVVMLLLMHHPSPCRQSAASCSIGDETRPRPVRRSTRWGKEIEGGIEAMLGKRRVTI